MTRPLEQAATFAAPCLYAIAVDNPRFTWWQVGYEAGLRCRAPERYRGLYPNGQNHRWLSQVTQRAVRRYCKITNRPWPYRHRGGPRLGTSAQRKGLPGRD